MSFILFRRHWLSALQRGTEVAGLSVCVRDNKGVIFNKAYGVHEKISGAPLKKDAIFPVASQTKTFTAVALLKLVLDSKIGLDDKLVSYLPQFSHPLLDQVTLRDALSHQTRFVPGFSGAKLLRIHTGTPAAVTGRSVLGCSTLAPK